MNQDLVQGLGYCGFPDASRLQMGNGQGSVFLHFLFLGLYWVSNRPFRLFLWASNVRGGPRGQMEISHYGK